ncbi:Peroxisomal hydratase-dehydrogenase-epimerase [Fonsecaea pedrosoi]|nr:Peroxisomal hydratase-dehydrogenase-epimerase [Fonsecaea pedrosoi]
MVDLRLDNHVAIITGAGSGLGKAHALYLASRGASVLVNDVSRKDADEVVGQIVSAGGRSAVNYNSVLNGDVIVQDAIQKFGRLDILVNSVFKCTRAAWKIFRKQKYGRIIMTSSTAGLFGNSGQCNYSAATLGAVGLTQTLAKEGLKYNILVNAIAPVTAADMTATTTSAELLQYLRPEHVSPLVGLLVHPISRESGSVFEVFAGHVSKFRWERSPGAVLKCDETFTPGAILKRWADINDFSKPDHPTKTADMVVNLEAAQKQDRNDPGEDVRYDGKVAVITGGGAGLGRAYCIEFAKRGAAVVVNDLVNPNSVVEEILASGGRAVGNSSSVEDGASVIKTAIDNFGRVDILVNNAGILRDKAFINMTEKQWDDIFNVHLHGTYACTKAAYPYMMKQKYGRIVNTSSTSGVYGNYGQANYATAKMAILGFSRALAEEGAKYNIYVNTIGPSAGTQLTRTVLSEELVHARKPEFVAPLVLALCSDKVPDRPTGGLYEVGCGWQGRTRWQRSDGHTFDIDQFTPENIRDHWDKITNFADKCADSPETLGDEQKHIIGVIRWLMSRKQSTSINGNSYPAAPVAKL